ncbi:MAG: hypothetical protein WDZ39_01365 [Candidatus Spechtbacterales bacterium]
MPKKELKTVEDFREAFEALRNLDTPPTAEEVRQFKKALTAEVHASRVEAQTLFRAHTEASRRNEELHNIFVALETSQLPVSS